MYKRQVGTEGTPSYQVSGGVAAFLNWEGYCFRGGAEGTKVLELLLGDPSKTRVHHKATWRARRCLITQLGWKEVWFAESVRNEMVSEYITNSEINLKIYFIAGCAVVGVAGAGSAGLHPDQQEGGASTDSECKCKKIA